MRQARELLRLPQAGWLLAGSLIGRASTPIIDVALVVFLATKVSYGLAGACVFLYSGIGALAGLFKGRLLDRYGSLALAPLLAAYLLGMAGLLLTQQPGFLLAASLLMGLGVPPLSGLARSGWSRLAGERDEELTDSINWVDALCSHLVTLVGPLLALLLLVLLSPVEPLLIAGLLLSLGCGLMVVALGRDIPAASAGAPPLRDPSYRWLILCVMVWGGMIGALQVGLSARAEQLGWTEGMPLLWALIALGGFGCSLLWAQRLAHWPLHRAWLLHGLVLLGLPWLGLAGLLLYLPLVGAAGAPQMLVAYRCAVQLVDRSRLTEAFSGKATAAYMGAGLGAIPAGVLADIQPRWSLLLAGLLVLGAAALGFWQRERLAD